ncbi:hypothetical protein SSCG_02738 [Streptomyces clavuligerus]|nr:hypothetical protein SSCG_02738 [Streptomyces clavuligerus]
MEVRPVNLIVQHRAHVLLRFSHSAYGIRIGNPRSIPAEGDLDASK